MQTHRTIIAAVILLAIVSTLLSIFAYAQQSKDDIWYEIERSDRIRVGIDASYPPFESLDSNGVIVGFDADFARAIAGELGVSNTDLVNIAYDGLYDALLTRKVDALISALAIVPQYQGRAIFSQPYFNAGEMLLVSGDSTIQSMENLAGRRVAVEYGSEGDVEIRQWERRLRELQVIRKEDANSAIKALLDHEVDAVLVNGIAGRLALGSSANLRLALYASDTLFAIATHPDAPLLASKVEIAIEALQNNGTISRLIDKWFGEIQSP